MKIKSLLIGMLACTALVGCTNDDAIDNLSNENPALKGNSYLSVNLSMGNPSSRSTQTENFDNGSEAEAAVKDDNVIFLFYDAEGNYVTEGTIQYYDETNGLTEADGSDFLDWTEKADGSNVERTANPVVVLGPTKTVPAKVIAILNNNTLATTFKGMNMSETLERVTNTTDYMVEGAGYVMSNSAYVDGNNVVYATDIAPEKICETAAAAVANPVDIYVERVAAKVAMSYATGVGTNNEFTLASSANGGKYMVDDQVKSLKVRVAGWTVNAINETSSLIKYITTTNYFTNWNNTANYRSYWAEDVNYSGVTTVAENATPEPWEHTGVSFEGLTYKTWKDADKAGAESPWNGVVEYLNENTTNQPVIRPNDKTNATTLLVAGHIIVEGNSTGVTLFTYKGGYYTADAYKAILMGALKGINKVVDGENVALEATDFVWTETKEGNTIPTYKATKVDYQTVVLKPTLEEGVTLEDGKTITDIHTALAAYETKLYLDGRCYYQIPIKHIFDNEADTDVCGEYGIVRNHSYNLTLTSITNIGGAVFDPESEELDHIPGAENDYYIAATLNVLAWRVVANQNVEL